MYLEFYGLTSKPFELLPDPRFLYVSRGHDLALTRLEDGITNHKPFIVLSGEVGTGKTTLLNYLLKKIKDDTNIAMIVNPNLEPQEFLELVLRRFRGDSSFQEGNPPFEELRSFLLEQHAIGRRSFLIVDEAQNVPIETLEQVRLLTNLQTDEDNLLQIILSGQQQLKQRLRSPELAELSQRVSVHYHLYPLEEAEVDRYIQHRLRVAGYSGTAPLFSPEAVQKIHLYTNGVPRLINSVCDTALIYGFSEDATTLGLDIVQKVINDRRAQIGDNGEVLAGVRSASSYYERVETPALEAAEPAGETEIGNPLDRSPEARRTLDSASGPQREENSPQVEEQIGESGDSNVQLRKKADLIACHYRNLWSLNQENRERLATLGSHYSLLWRHYELLRKERATLITESSLLKEQLNAKNDRIHALQDAFRILLDQNRALKKRLGHDGPDKGDDPEKHPGLPENPGTASE